MTKLHRLALFVPIIALASPLPALASGPAPAVERRAPSVTVSTATRGDIREILMVTGSFVAREEVLVNPEQEGLQIVAILADEGDTVAAGQVLARLNREALDVMLAQNAAQIARANAATASSRATIQEATANKRLADEQLARTQTLQRTGVATNDQLDQRMTAARAAEARLTSAQNQLQISEADLALAREQRRDIELRLARTEIRARVGGVISRRNARLGQIATSNPVAEPMFRIISEGRVELEADVAETTLARLRAGQRVTLESNGLDTQFFGTVRLVSPEVARTSRLGRVRIAIDGAERPPVGTFGRAAIQIREAQGVLVPLSSVFFAPSGTASVQVVKDGLVETREVIPGLRAEGRVEIRRGLAVGEQVITIAGTFVRNGDRVNPVAQAVR